VVHDDDAFPKLFRLSFLFFSIRNNGDFNHFHRIGERSSRPLDVESDVTGKAVVDSSVRAPPAVALTTARRRNCKEIKIKLLM